MWSKEQILQYLKANLKEARFKHTLGVAITAVQLAEANNEDKERTEIAALLHDAAKNLSEEELCRILEENSLYIDEIERRVPELLHGKVAAVLGKKIMGIHDEEILSAVACHTTGKRNMTTLEKIIYIADTIEPGRYFRGIDELRELTFKSLDEGVLKGIDNTVKYIIRNGGLIHPQTIDARNYLITYLKESR
ncbi:MAG: bis(5'-nucleosyl)-tetraphosphatase (symmetrical) YqeK [Clostridiaceae bacterium]